MPLWKKRKWESSKPLSPIDTSRERAWERKRKMWERMMARRGKNKRQDCFDDITDEDLRELRGCIELGFGFNEEDAQDLCATLPALELYFAVNRQVSASPRSNVNDSPAAIASPTTVDPDAWKICSPGMYIILYILLLFMYICLYMHAHASPPYKHITYIQS